MRLGDGRKRVTRNGHQLKGWGEGQNPVLSLGALVQAIRGTSVGTRLGLSKNDQYDGYRRSRQGYRSLVLRMSRSDRRYVYGVVIVRIEQVRFGGPRGSKPTHGLVRMMGVLPAGVSQGDN